MWLTRGALCYANDANGNTTVSRPSSIMTYNNTWGHVKEAIMSSHSLRLHIEVALAMFGTVLFAVFACILALDMLRRIELAESRGIWTSIALSLFLIFGFAAATVFMIWEARAMWFCLYRYRVSDSILDVYDPILQKRWAVRLDKVTAVRTFYILHGSRDKRARRGHTLMIGDHNAVRLSEALPIWPQIAERCSHADFEEMRVPWWGSGRMP
jgi:hypothetical protein